MNLEAGEQDQLEKDRDVLANITEIKSTLGGARLAPPMAPTMPLPFWRCYGILRAVFRCSTMPTISWERLNTAHIELRDIADTLSDFDRDSMPTPTSSRPEQRLNDIYSLQSKHHVSSVEALIELRENFRIKLSSLEKQFVYHRGAEKEARRARLRPGDCRRAYTPSY